MGAFEHSCDRSSAPEHCQERRVCVWWRDRVLSEIGQAVVLPPPFVPILWGLGGGNSSMSKPQTSKVQRNRFRCRTTYKHNALCRKENSKTRGVHFFNSDTSAGSSCVYLLWGEYRCSDYIHQAWAPVPFVSTDRLHEREGCAVHWLGCSGRVRGELLCSGNTGCPIINPLPVAPTVQMVPEAHMASNPVIGILLSELLPVLLLLHTHTSLLPMKLRSES